MVGMVDWLLVGVIFLVVPLRERSSHLVLKKEIEERGDEALRKGYRRIMLWEWTALAAVLGALVARGIDVAVIGVRVPALGPTLMAGGAAAVIVGYFAWSLRAVATRERLADQARTAMEPLDYFLPGTPAAYSTFAALSFTAGIVEELLYRGYLIWVLSAVMPLWGAAVVSSLLFGLDHLYQGVLGAVRIAIVGLVAAGIYLLAGAIWVPILLHVATDLLQGRLAYVVKTLPLETSGGSATA